MSESGHAHLVYSPSPKRKIRTAVIYFLPLPLAFLLKHVDNLGMRAKFSLTLRLDLMASLQNAPGFVTQPRASTREYLSKRHAASLLQAT
ncbi:hypothetical protein L249_2641 [Ophiocordyceps polyrhachis-furcata BCC 54312]|uniref:Uncharacterized protein n=1 Tax=Ophiocordyceps polyrhachis-furcata BCC 54312 TaxID=1330021 RepID=A0A367LQ91_9HYPO|nr:hypothetical protein L249_2641 [Ophiocordyceps polyrhachis-furcata BCC 54312]